MKKFILGIMLFTSGFIGTLAFLITSIYNPWQFNDIGGFLGFLLGTNMLIPFIVFTIISLIGLYICVYESYLKGKKVDKNI